MEPDDEYLGPTQIRIDRGEVVREPGDRGGVQFRTYSIPLTFYEHRGIITFKQKLAGEKFYRTWYYGCLRSPYVLMRWTEVRYDKSELNSAGFLWSEYRAAMQAIRGTQRKRIAYKVCCDEKYAGEGRITILREALDFLMDHFRASEREKSISHDETSINDSQTIA
jgi:hypothetical protein